MRQVEKAVLLQTIDHHWREHLMLLDYLRQAVGLRSYAQRDPLNEYKSEALALFKNLLTRLREDVTRQLMNTQFVKEIPNLGDTPLIKIRINQVDLDKNNDKLASLITPCSSTVSNNLRVDFNPENPTTWGKISRNTSCPCNSGKKYKHCHGVLI
jgi:preprotein translocase subunit SecA